MFKNFIKGLLFGSTIGAVLGLLFAPSSGKETQEKLKKELDDFKEPFVTTAENAQTLSENATNLQETVDELLPTFQKGMSDAVTKFQFKANPRILEINKTIERITQSLENFSDTKK